MKRLSRCPSCEKGILVSRTRKADGRAFWGCSNYPDCTYTMNVFKRVELESPPDDPGQAEEDWEKVELYLDKGDKDD